MAELIPLLNTVMTTVGQNQPRRGSTEKISNAAVILGAAADLFGRYKSRQNSRTADQFNFNNALRIGKTNADISKLKQAGAFIANINSKLAGRDINNQRILEEVVGQESWNDARSNIKEFSHHSDESFDTFKDVEEAHRAGTLEDSVFNHWRKLYDAQLNRRKTLFQQAGDVDPQELQGMLSGISNYKIQTPSNATGFIDAFTGQSRQDIISRNSELNQFMVTNIDSPLQKLKDEWAAFQSTSNPKEEAEFFKSENYSGFIPEEIHEQIKNLPSELRKKTAPAYFSALKNLASKNEGGVISSQDAQDAYFITAYGSANPPEAVKALTFQQSELTERYNRLIENAEQPSEKLRLKKEFEAKDTMINTHMDLALSMPNTQGSLDALQKSMLQEIKAKNTLINMDRAISVLPDGPAKTLKQQWRTAAELALATGDPATFTNNNTKYIELLTEMLGNENIAGFMDQLGTSWSTYDLKQMFPNNWKKIKAYADEKNLTYYDSDSFDIESMNEGDKGRYKASAKSYLESLGVEDHPEERYIKNLYSQLFPEGNVNFPLARTRDMLENLPFNDTSTGQNNNLRLERLGLIAEKVARENRALGRVDNSAEDIMRKYMLFALDSEWRGKVLPEYKNMAFLTQDGDDGYITDANWKLAPITEGSVRDILRATNRLFTQSYGNYLSAVYDADGHLSINPTNNFTALNTDDKLNVINNDILPQINKGRNSPKFNQSRQALIEQLLANEDSLIWSADQGKIIKIDKGPAPVKPDTSVYSGGYPLLDEDDPDVPVEQFALSSQIKETKEEQENPNLNLVIPKGQFTINYTKPGVPLEEVDDSLLSQTSEGSWGSKAKRRSRLTKDTKFSISYNNGKININASQEEVAGPIGRPDKVRFVDLPNKTTNDKQLRQAIKSYAAVVNSNIERMRQIGVPEERIFDRTAFGALDFRGESISVDDPESILEQVKLPLIPFDVGPSDNINEEARLLKSRNNDIISKFDIPGVWDRQDIYDLLLGQRESERIVEKVDLTPTKPVTPPPSTVNLLGKPQAPTSMPVDKTLQDTLNEVGDIFNDGKSARNFLAEITMAESNMGQDDETYTMDVASDGSRGSLGVAQIDENGAYAHVMERLRAPAGVPNYLVRGKFREKILDATNGEIDVLNVKYEDLADDRTNLIFARLYLLTFKGGISSNVNDRATWWKKNYNSVLGKGTTKHYINAVNYHTK